MDYSKLIHPFLFFGIKIKKSKISSLHRIKLIINSMKILELITINQLISS